MELKKLQGGKIKKYNLGGIVGGTAQVALGIGQTIYGMSTLRKANKEMDSLLANAPQLTLPSAYQQYAEKALSDTMLRRQTEAIQRNLSSSSLALGQAGGRALVGGLQGAVSGSEASMLEAQAAQNQQAMQGLGVLGQAQERLRTATEDRFRMQYGAAAAAKDAALANIGGGLKAAGMGLAVGSGAYEQAQEFGGGYNGSSSSTSSSSASSGGSSKSDFYGYDAWKNEKGSKLKGEFSHEKNPIHMINNSGQKVGEATGGEYILNPKQAAAISKESKYFRNLLKQKRFK